MGKRVVGNLSDSVHGKGTSSGSGDVVGPAVSTDSALVLFDGVTGKLIKNSNTLISLDGSFVANSDLLIPSQAAIKTYVDSKLSLNSSNYIETIPKNPFSDAITISGMVGSLIISPFTKSISQVWFYVRGSVGTNYPVQVALYETATPLSNTPTYTKLAQSGDIATTSAGFKSLTGLNIPIVQGYGYFITICRSASGGTTTPTLQGRNSSFNAVSGNIAATNFADTTPANFSTNVSANTVGTWVGGTSSGGATWVALFCQ